ncbi:MAG: septal ring lytic transglycosylase RlpA family protein [Synergistaceae bacterium]|jgi:rare lipoprotein A|nr:septal ring lytic transglycosylase RlpA family protein [Synergistaceae bacterium]
MPTNFLEKIGIVLIFTMSAIQRGETANAVPSAVVRDNVSVAWRIGGMTIWRFPAAHSDDAAELSRRFNDQYRGGFKIEDLRVSEAGGKWSLLIGDRVLISPNSKHSGAAALRPDILALELMSRIYEALGNVHAPALTPEHRIGGKYDVSGPVSWYGGKFIGKKFANGERFTDTHLTAAARDLPFGTLVKVTAPSTGKSVVVRITDRFGGHKDRLLDVSHAAAELLGIRRSGVTEARLEVIGRVSGIGGN